MSEECETWLAFIADCSLQDNQFPGHRVLILMAEENILKSTIVSISSRRGNALLIHDEAVMDPSEQLFSDTARSVQ
jgi:hypothetical protein